jgi:C4-dicarboxylate-specific signal transduction histidine kinase
VGIEAFVLFDEDLLQAFVDFIQIQQVFVNLISNAIDAMEGRPVLPYIKIRAAKGVSRY